MKLLNIKSIFKSFFIDWNEFSIGVAYGRFRRDVPLGSWTKRQTIYENSILNYLKKQYAYTFAKYKHTEFYAESDNYKESEQRIVWVMWWQGEDNMPPIVKACYNSIVESCKSCDVVLITEKKVKDYIVMDDEIVRKYNEGKITTTHLSDYIRISLLRRYGGLWIDATILCSDEIKEIIWDADFFTLRNPGMFPSFISRGDWSTYLLYCKKSSNNLMACIEETLIQYWRDHDLVIDYLLFDFIIRISIENNAVFQSALNEVDASPFHYQMNALLNQTLSDEEYNILFHKSLFHKLTYKGLDTAQSNSVYKKILRNCEIS